MYPLLFDHFNKYATISEADFSKIAAVLELRSFRKKKVLLRAGEICRDLYFIQRGALRTYTIDKDGITHVVQIGLEDHWIGDLGGAITQKPCTLNMDAIEDTEVLLLPYAAMEQLCDEIPALDKFFRKLIQRAYVALQYRLNATHAVSAAERYKELIRLQPQIAVRIPLIHIASYLGIKAESLSRIRRMIAEER